MAKREDHTGQIFQGRFQCIKYIGHILKFKREVN